MSDTHTHTHTQASAQTTNTIYLLEVNEFGAVCVEVEASAVAGGRGVLELLGHVRTHPLAVQTKERPAHLKETERRGSDTDVTQLKICSGTIFAPRPSLTILTTP